MLEPNLGTPFLDVGSDRAHSRNSTAPKSVSAGTTAKFVPVEEWPSEHAYGERSERITGWRWVAVVLALWAIGLVVAGAFAWLVYQCVIVVDWLVRVAP